MDGVKTSGANIARIEETTERAWTAWVEELDAAGARELGHGAIAEHVQAQLAESRADLENPGWWAQAVTVAYEQHIGRRQPGQNCDGEWRVTISRTLPGSIDEAFERWLEFVDGRSAFADIPWNGRPVVGDREGRWRRWRVDLADGSRVNLDIDAKVPSAREAEAGVVKARLSVTHGRLPDGDAVEVRRVWWKTALADL